MKNNKSKSVLKIFGAIFLIAGIIMLTTGVAMAFNSDPFESFDAVPILLPIGGVSIFVGVVMLSISATAFAFKKFKALSSEMLGEGTNESDSFIDLVKKSIKKQREAQIKAHTCDYCGCNLKDDETKCPNCGAPKQR